MSKLDSHLTSLRPSAPPVIEATRRRDRVVSAVAIGAFVVGSAIWIAVKGLFVHTDTVVLWVLAGLLALTLTDLRRWGLRLFADWLPLGALLVLYDQSAPLAKWLGRPLHIDLQIKFDEALFGKPLLTLQLQHALGQTAAVRWWEYPLWAIYMTHFFVALVIAGVLWRFAYPRFREFRTQIVVLTTLGFVTYVIYPAAPPWYVAQKLHLLPWIYRTVFEAWTKAGLHTAASLANNAIEGNGLGNQLAAVPSMHAAVSLFVACFFWRGARAWLRIVLVLYVLTMAFTLVYSGEHYFFDIVVGWFYAIIVLCGTWAVRSYRRSRAGPDAPALDEAPALSPAL